MDDGLSDEQHDAARRKVHSALGEFLGEGEIVVGWITTIEVAGPNDLRYLAHRTGGGVDGTDSPAGWTQLGMLETWSDSVREQLLASGEDPDEDDN